MPGARLRSYRLGDRSELLVEHLLAGIAYTTRVPRQEDIGIDFLCSLITGDEGDNLLKAGPFFAVQAKSSADPIIYKKPHELEWIKNQENPILLCVADRDNAAMDVYSTWNLLCGILGGASGGTITPSSITLRPGKTGTTWPGVEDGPNCSQEILLGKPIIQIRHEDIFNESSTRRIGDVLRAWVALDRINIVRRQAGLYFVEGPPAYQTGEPPQQLATASYWNPQNLETCTKNLILAATSLWNVLRHPQISMKADVNKSPWIEGSKALQELLRWCEVMEPKLRGFVRGLEDEP